jgi:4a-hydroxytetrahydrobiopterin dehydratase
VRAYDFCKTSVERQQKEQLMEIQATEQLIGKKCKPCEGGVDACTLDEARDQLQNLTGWHLTHDGQRIRKNWTVKNFMAGMDFFNRVAGVAEADGHHPDLHIEGYRNVWIELWTHAIGGLSENDFILAAKIDQLPIEARA